MVTAFIIIVSEGVTAGVACGHLSIMAGIGREYNVPGEYAAIFRNIQELLSCYPLLFIYGYTLGVNL